ncbi:hypothetical protein AB0I06_24870, partial [Streptomyces sp. NPDC050674]
MAENPRTDGADGSASDPPANTVGEGTRTALPSRAETTAAHLLVAHTCVTLLLGLGTPHIVRDIVGHSTLNVTMNI